MKVCIGFIEIMFLYSNKFNAILKYEYYGNSVIKTTKKIYIYNIRNTLHNSCFMMIEI